jgi:hypothetical protein
VFAGFVIVCEGVCSQGKNVVVEEDISRDYFFSLFVIVKKKSLVCLGESHEGASSSDRFEGSVSY